MQVIRSAGISAMALAAACCAAIPEPVSAQTVQGADLTSGQPVSAGTLRIGQQVVLENAEGTFDFAGQSLNLSGFSGILGFSTEAAYVVVADGKAAIGDAEAGSGRMLLIPPYKAKPATARFDASRLAAQWSAEAATRHPAVHERLRKIARGQGRGVFLGRLGRTGLNLSAPGGANAEMARRSVKGAGAIPAIRFSGETDPAVIERKVVDAFLGALAAGDIEGVAALMDPVPFGNTDLRGGADDARRLLARHLMAERNWGTLLRNAQTTRVGESNIWTITGPNGRATLTLRPMGDFVFVRDIAKGEVQ